MDRLYAGLSYEQTVDKYIGTIYAVCVMRLSGNADVDDCVQNTFIKLYEKSPDFTDKNHLKAWLLRVAINECRMSTLHPIVSATIIMTQAVKLTGCW